MITRFGKSAVPWTVSWSAEETFSLGKCPVFGKLAIMQISDLGSGKPLFGKPHSNRQREAIGRCLCDLCGRPIKMATKVSLSHARPQPRKALGHAKVELIHWTDRDLDWLMQ
jgi:hypothetical protein